MANELNISLGVTGLTVTAKVYTAGDVANGGTAVSCPEIASQGGIYSGNMPSVAAGFYEVQFFAGGVVVGSGTINWDGTAESHGGDVTVQNYVTVAQLVAASASNPLLITEKNSCTLRRTLPGIGTITGRSKLWFTIKAALTDADSASIVQITEAGGLLTVNGSAPTSSSLASLTVTDASQGIVDVVIDESIMAQIEPCSDRFHQYVWGCKVLISGDVSEPIDGHMLIVGAVTRAIT